MSRLSIFLLLSLFEFFSSNYGLIINSNDNKKILSKIVNGEKADIKEFPYLVSLQYNGTFYGHDYDHFCCGSIINERWIITSAQCALPNVENFHVRAGSSQYFENGVVYTIDEIVVHPRFNEISRDFDVGLLKLSKKISFSENVRPIKLPSEDEITADGTSFSIAGWGATQLLGKISDDLLKSHVQKISGETCQASYGDSVTDRMFCVFTEGYGPCVGDSGSPAVFNDKIIGVTSWSYGCAYQNPTVYAKVSSVLNWIKDTTSNTN